MRRKKAKRNVCSNRDKTTQEHLLIFFFFFILFIFGSSCRYDELSWQSGCVILFWKVTSFFISLKRCSSSRHGQIERAYTDARISVWPGDSHLTVSCIPLQKPTGRRIDLTFFKSKTQPLSRPFRRAMRFRNGCVFSFLFFFLLVLCQIVVSSYLLCTRASRKWT